MKLGEDHGSRTPEDAERYERARARSSGEHDYHRAVRGLGRRQRCTCTAVSLEPCRYCSSDPGERE